MKFNVVTIAGLVILALGVLALLGVGIPGSETISAGGLSATVETERAVDPLIAGVIAAIGLGATIVGQKMK